MRRLCHLPVLFRYRSRTTCTSGCNDYADAFCQTLARAVSPITAVVVVTSGIEAFRLLR